MGNYYYYYYHYNDLPENCKDNTVDLKRMTLKRLDLLAHQEISSFPFHPRFYVDIHLQKQAAFMSSKGILVIIIRELQKLVTISYKY